MGNVTLLAAPLWYGRDGFECCLGLPINMAEDEDQVAAAPDPGSEDQNTESSSGAAVYDVPVEITAVLGTAQIKVSDLLKLGRGAVIELDRGVGDPVDILVNQRRVAFGEIIVVEDRLGVTLTETLKMDKL